LSHYVRVLVPVMSMLWAFCDVSVLRIHLRLIDAGCHVDQPCACCCLPRVCNKYGVHPARRFYHVYGQHIARKTGGNANITFKEVLVVCCDDRVEHCRSVKFDEHFHDSVLLLCPFFLCKLSHVSLLTWPTVINGD